MTQKTKRTIVDVGSTILTLGTSAMIELLVGGGTVAILNRLFGETMTKGQAKILSGIVFTGSVGVAALTASEVHPKLVGIMQDTMDLFPTDKEEKDG